MGGDGKANLLGSWPRNICCIQVESSRPQCSVFLSSGRLSPSASQHGCSLASLPHPGQPHPLACEVCRELYLPAMLWAWLLEKWRVYLLYSAPVHCSTVMWKEASENEHLAEKRGWKRKFAGFLVVLLLLI